MAQPEDWRRFYFPDILHPEELTLTVSPDLVQLYKGFASHPRLQNPAVVYYPSCSYDTSPSAAFESVRVMYANIDERPVAALQAAGHEAYAVDETTFMPPVAADLVILLDTAIPPDGPVAALNVGGYIIANNYRSTADVLGQKQQLQYKGVLITLEDGTIALDTENLEDYFTEATTDEEFKNAMGGNRFANYESAASLVEAITGKREAVLENYHKILTERSTERDRELGVARIQVGDQTHAVVFELPRKKGNADSMFVFRKVGATAAEGETRPNFIVHNEVGRGVVTYNGKEYEYTILDPDVEQNLPGFVGFPHAQHLFISEEVPVEYREHVLRHEIREFIDLEGQPGRCVESLIAEIAGVPEDMRGAYILYRMDFFDRLVEHYRFTPLKGFKAEITRSRDYLHELVK